MKLIGSLGSPYVRKVRIVMLEKRIEYDFVLENVWSPNTTIQQYNPLGRVPCLMMEDGCAMFDSRVIVEYLDTLTPVGKLIPLNGRDRAEVKCWEALADGVLDAGMFLRLEKTWRPEEQRSQSWMDRQMTKINSGLQAMEIGLKEKAFCAGTHYSLADVAVGCVLGWLNFRFPDIAWHGHGQYPALEKLFEKLSERPSFKETLPQ